jgi:cellulose synthase (UDP-forming)
LLAPVCFALFNLPPMINVDLPAIATYVLPMTVSLIGGISVLAPGKYLPLSAQILTIFQTFRILPVALQTLFRPKGLLFKVTPKGSGAARGGWETTVLAMALLMMAASALSIGINLVFDARVVAPDSLMPVVAFWLTLNILMLFFVAMMCLEKPRLRAEERFKLKNPVSVINAHGEMFTSADGDMSLSGIGIFSDQFQNFAVGDRVQVVVSGVGIIRGFVRRTGKRLGIVFDFHSADLRDRLMVHLFTNPIETNRLRTSGWSASVKLVRRLWEADLRVNTTATETPPVIAELPRLPAQTLLIAPQVAGASPLRGKTYVVEGGAGSDPAPVSAPAPARRSVG